MVLAIHSPYGLLTYQLLVQQVLVLLHSFLVTSVASETALGAPTLCRDRKITAILVFIFSFARQLVVVTSRIFLGHIGKR